MGRLSHFLLLVQAGGQYGVHRLEGAGIVFEGSFCRSPDSFRAVVLAQAYDAHAGAVALLGIGAGRDDPLYQLGGRRAYFGRPLDEAGRIPFGIVLMLRRHMFFERSLLILPFVGIVALSVPFVRQGDLIGSINIWSWNISVTRTGLQLFLSIMMKAWLSALSLILLISTTRVVDLLNGLEHMRVPMVLVTIISFMYRYIFVLTDDMMRMKQARDSRNFGGSHMWRIRTIGNMIGTLFVRSYERGERIYSAMLARGYDGSTRTLHKLSFAHADYIFGILVGVALLASGIWANLVR